MKNLMYAVSLLWCCAYLPAFGQDSTACNAAFGFTISGHTVSFHSLNQSAAHKWTFGDAGTSDNANPTHTYASAGTYWVTHIIKDTVHNCRDTVTREIHITDSVDCNITAAFNWHRDSSNCKKIVFSNQSTPISPNVHFVWKFGDGTSSNDINVTHTYAQEGNYNVCLVMEAGNNCRRELCKTIEVHCAPPPPPPCNVQAKFEWRRDSLQWNKIWFRNLSLPIPNIWKTSWSYGDGTSSQDFNSYHVYQQPGKYYVCLKVQSLNGCISTWCDSVLVRNPVNCDSMRLKFEFTRNQEHPYILTFHAISNMPIVQQTWTITRLSNTPVFPPPTPIVINGNNPTYTFKDSGLYQVCVYAVTANNCKRTYCERIYIEHGQNGRALISGNIAVYPNPANRLVRIDVDVPNNTLLQVRVLDNTGTAKMQFVSPARAGTNNLSIPVERLSSGLYVVEIRYGNQLKLAKFQKS